MNRKQIIRACKGRGYSIQPTALETLFQICSKTEHNDDDAEVTLQHVLDAVIIEMKQQQQMSRTITKEVIQKIMELDKEIDNNKNTTTAGNDYTKSAVNRKHNHSITTSTVIRQTQQQQQKRKDKNDNTNSNTIEVISAFETPRLVYEVMRKQFRIDDQNQWSLLGTAEDKIDMLAQRYALIHQRVLRHPLFRPSHLGHQFFNNSTTTTTSSNRGSNGTSTLTRSNSIQHKLTHIECLLGGGEKNNTVLVLGILIQIEEGQFYLEDPTGQVPITLQNSDDTIFVDGFFVTEYCILLVEGMYQNGLFYVSRLGQPLQEERKTSLHAIQQQLSHPYYATTRKQLTISNSASSSSSPFVILSDVHMDQPRVIQQLESLFATYENYSVHRLPCFVLMGNFCSPVSHQSQQVQQQQQKSYWDTSSSSTSRTVAAMEELLTMIEKFSKLARYAHFCIIPGSNDYNFLGSSHLHILPYPPLDKVIRSSITSISASKNITNLHYGSNPCRIRYSGYEMVVFRYDLLHLMQQNQLLTQKTKIENPDHDRSSCSMDDDDVDSDDKNENHHRLPHCRLVKTILDQGHLVPVSNVPIYWNYDSALRLYPLPDVLILGGDMNTNPYHEIYGGCQVIHPGCFAHHSTILNQKSSTTNKNNTTTTTNNNNMGGNYTVFTPGVVDSSSDDDDEDISFTPTNDKVSAVEFMQIGNTVGTTS